MTALARLVFLRAVQMQMRPAPVPVEAAAEQQPDTSPNAAMAHTLRERADMLQDIIDRQLRPLSQNPTPKRLRQLATRQHDGRNLQRAQQALRVLADLWEKGTCPGSLMDIDRVSKVLRMVATKFGSNGYYDYHELPNEFSDDSDEAKLLRALVAGSTESSPVATGEEIKLQQLLNEARLANHEGFFPTPDAVIDRMIALAELDDTGTVLTILEPSAGAGHIIDKLAAHPNSKHFCVHAYETNPKLREILQLKGYPAYGRAKAFPLCGNSGVLHVQPDFLQGGRCRYGRILMNPPFENDQDMLHVRHAYEDCLRPGGVLVAVMCTGWRFRETGIAPKFREWLSEHVGNRQSWELLAPDAFNGKDAFRRTGVQCGILTLRKAP